MVTPDGSDDGPTVTGRTRLKRERITRVNLVISTRLTALLHVLLHVLYNVSFARNKRLWYKHFEFVQTLSVAASL